MNTELSQAEYEGEIHKKLTYKTGIEADIFCSFSNIQVSYLCSTRNNMNLCQMKQLNRCMV